MKVDSDEESSSSTDFVVPYISRTCILDPSLNATTLSAPCCPSQPLQSCRYELDPGLWMPVDCLLDAIWQTCHSTAPIATGFQDRPTDEARLQGSATSRMWHGVTANCGTWRFLLRRTGFYSWKYQDKTRQVRMFDRMTFPLP